MTTVTIRTNFSPDISFDPTNKTSAQSGQGILALVRPTVDVNLPVIGPVHYAPYGEPTGWGMFVLVAIVALAAFGLYKLIK